MSSINCPFTYVQRMVPSSGPERPSSRPPSLFSDEDSLQGGTVMEDLLATAPPVENDSMEEGPTDEETVDTNNAEVSSDNGEEYEDEEYTPSRREHGERRAQSKKDTRRISVPPSNSNKKRTKTAGPDQPLETSPPVVSRRRRNSYKRLRGNELDCTPCKWRRIKCNKATGTCRQCKDFIKKWGKKWRCEVDESFERPKTALIPAEFVDPRQLKRRIRKLEECLGSKEVRRASGVSGNPSAASLPHMAVEVAAPTSESSNGATIDMTAPGPSLGDGSYKSVSEWVDSKTKQIEAFREFSKTPNSKKIRDFSNSKARQIEQLKNNRQVRQFLKQEQKFRNSLLPEGTKAHILRLNLESFLELDLDNIETSPASPSHGHLGTEDQPITIKDEEHREVSPHSTNVDPEVPDDITSVRQLIETIHSDIRAFKRLIADLGNEGRHELVAEYKEKIRKLNQNLRDPVLKAYLEKEKGIEKDIVNERMKRSLFKDNLANCLRKKNWKC